MEAQQEVCARNGVVHVAVPQHAHVNVTSKLLEGTHFVYGLRLAPTDDRTGWFFWTEELFPPLPRFSAIQVAEFEERWPEVIKFLGLPPGWRFVVDGYGYEREWEDRSFLNEEHVARASAPWHWWTDTLSRRRKVLLACAWCRHMWKMLGESRCRPLIEAIELLIDDRVDTGHFQVVLKAAAAEHYVSRQGFFKVRNEANQGKIAWDDRRLRTITSADEAISAAYLVGANVDDARFVHNNAYGHMVKAIGDNASPDRQEQAQNAAEGEAAVLAWHIIGNPFRSITVPDSWPVTVVQLAEAIYNGEECGFALHDALLDSGQADLAQHFREQKQHPKGCWALDLLLGKE